MALYKYIGKKAIRLRHLIISQMLQAIAKKKKVNRQYLSVGKGKKMDMKNKREEKNHLSVFGIGPALCFPMVIISAVAIVLSVKGIIPFAITNKTCNIILLVAGILLILEGMLCFVGADFGGGLVENIKSNHLKTNGSYAFVRNPCYAVYFLGCTGALLIAHNPVLLVLPFVFWLEMTIVLKNTEEKWLRNLYGQEYVDYCKKVNRCIPWFTKKNGGK